LQRLGTEFGRNQMGEHFWVHLAFRDVGADDRLVITDLRFRNEALAIKSRGGITVCIERPGVGPANDHPSEHDLNGWHFDHVVVNDGTVASSISLLESIGSPSPT
jgi:hypothetical protein